MALLLYNFMLYQYSVISALQDISDALNKPFWLEYDFWMGLITLGTVIVNLVVLAITLYFLIRSTTATERMQKEAIRQRVLGDAKDIRLDMKGKHYLEPNPGGAAFCELETAVDTTTISHFWFLGKDYKAIGYCSPFYLKLQTDTNLHANYKIDTAEGRKKFVETLQLGNGFIKAMVTATSGNRFIYTFQAYTDNWKIALDPAHPNTEDALILVVKQIDNEFFASIQK